jgi:hypothetical protein
MKILFIILILLTIPLGIITGCTTPDCNYSCDFHACFNHSTFGDKQVTCSHPHDYRYNYCIDLNTSHSNCPTNKTERIYNETLTRW